MASNPDNQRTLDEAKESKKEAKKEAKEAKKEAKVCSRFCTRLSFDLFPQGKRKASDVSEEKVLCEPSDSISISPWHF